MSMHVSLKTGSSGSLPDDLVGGLLRYVTTLAGWE
jgi:hypothetical protein